MDLIGGGVDSRGSYVSKILYVKTKELGPLGTWGTRRAHPPLDPPMSCLKSLLSVEQMVNEIDIVKITELCNARQKNLIWNKNAFQSKAHLPLADRKSSTYNLT